MELWTHHLVEFPVNDPNLIVDHTRGQYWEEEMIGVDGFCYRDVLPRLHTCLGTTQFLWCCTRRDCYPRASEDVDKDLMEWELNVPLTQVLTFYRGSVWEDILWSKSDNWDRLLIAVGETAPAGNQLNDLGALARVPLEPKWAKCHGQLPPNGVARPCR